MKWKSMELYFCPYCGNISNTASCGKCKNVLLEKRALYEKCSYSPLDQSAVLKCHSKMAEKLQARVDKSLSKANEYLKKTAEDAAKVCVTCDADRIRQDKATLLQFLKEYLKTEETVAALSKVYSIVCVQLTDAETAKDFDAELAEPGIQKALCAPKPQEKPLTEKQIAEQAELLAQQKLANCKPPMPEKPILPDMPEKPKEPRTLHPGMPPVIPPEPAEPVYETPGFLNRKRVEKQNESKKIEFEQRKRERQSAIQMKAQYDTVLARYQQEQQDYRNAMAAYETAMARYQAALEQSEAQYNEELALYEKELRAYEKKYRAEVKQAREQLKLEKEARNKEIEEESKAALDHLGDYTKEAVQSFLNQKRLDFLKTQKKTLETALKAAIAEQKKLCATGVIYPKYQTLVAAACMLEYLESGRCDTLTGEHGAYNLYENEIHTGLIKPVLEQMLTSLETFKAKESLLYASLQNLSEFTEKASKQLNICTAVFKGQTTNKKQIAAWIEGKKTGSMPPEEDIPPKAKKAMDEFETSLRRYCETLEENSTPTVKALEAPKSRKKQGGNRNEQPE